LQGALDLVAAQGNLLKTIAQFSIASGSSGFSQGALKAQIDAMVVAQPSANANSAQPKSPSSSAASTSPPLPGLAAAGAAASLRFGIWELAANAIRLSEKIGAVDALDRRTAALQGALLRIRDPLIEQLKSLAGHGDALSGQADAADTAALNSLREQLDALAGQFKQFSALLIPLSKEGLLLDQYRRNLGNWRGAVEKEYREALKRLAIRVCLLLAFLAIVFTAAELWRRAVFRYVQDSRRRHQLLLIRRIVLWSLVVVIVGLAFASELGSIVTFAGLITAGLAVAMQSVLVSIVGYFFLIGKYGIRVGDRVQIGEVTGEVIDLGLVRMYLMELGGHGSLGPTGRVVAYANSIVFQVSSGLFKQIPGIDIAWHEITVKLPPLPDYASIKEQLLAATTAALKDHQEEIVRQTREIQRTTSSASGIDPQPQVQLNFSATGVEAHVRYPVHLARAGEIDERVSRDLFSVLSRMVPGAAPIEPPR
jgi:small-conductance mechanosensitive channel